LESDNQTENSGKQPDKETSNITPKPEFENSPYIATNQNETGNKEEQSRKVNEWKDYAKKWSEPLVIITLILALATFLLYWRATKDSGTAEKSAQAAISAASIADSSLQITKENIKFSDSVTKENIAIAQRNLAIAESTFKINQSAFISTDSNTKRSMEISIRSLRTQIENAEIARRTMEFEYRSDLKLKSARITQFAPNKPIEGIVEFTTIGRLPVTVDSVSTATTFAIMNDLAAFVKNPNDEIFKKLKPLGAVNKQYYREVNTYTNMISKDYYIDKGVLALAKTGGFLIVYAGKIVYENPINGKKRYYMFAVVIPPITPLPVDPNVPTFGEIYMKNGDVN